MLAATGLLGIGYEVLVVRVLSQVAENTVYTFAILLAVYLVGTALGAAAYGRWGRGGVSQTACCNALGVLHVGTLSLAGAAQIKFALMRMLGPGMAAALTAEAALAMRHSCCPRS